MPLKAVLDSDGLIKLAKASMLEIIVKAWTCLIPQAVYAETAERGIESAYQDAHAIRAVLQPSMLRPWVRHPRATILLQRKRGLGRGEQEALHLFFTARADAIISDDAAFVTMLDQADLPYLLPASVLVQLAHQRHLEPRAALEALERLRLLIRPEVYRAARADLEARPPRAPKGAKQGESP